MALTLQSALTQETFDMIAAEMLVVADNNYTYLQQCIPMEGTIEGGAKMVNFNAADLPSGTYTETSRRLTEGTAVSVSLAKAITMTQQTLTIREYGGPYSNTDSAVVPFGITDKMRRMAKHDLVQLIGGFMRRDRNRFVNQVIMDQCLSVTNITNPDGSLEGDLAAGAAATADWLRVMGKGMKDLLAPPFPNGRYKLIINTRQELELKRDPDIKAAFNYFAQANPLIITGQIGFYDVFDIFVDTLLPTKAVGAGGAVTGYQATAHGSLCCGHGSLQEPSIRHADDTDFQRQEKILWISLEAFGLLYGSYMMRGVTS